MLPPPGASPSSYAYQLSPSLPRTIKKHLSNLSLSPTRTRKPSRRTRSEYLPSNTGVEEEDGKSSDIMGNEGSSSERNVKRYTSGGKAGIMGNRERGYSRARGSGYMTDDERVIGFNDGDDEGEVEGCEERGLEETLERIGMGAYHWRLLALCGFGWMSDNSALQCIAVILPRVQVHYDLTARVVGLLSASTMAGMMIGAVGWGVLSDILGRALPFNATLLLTAVFGIAASYAPGFGSLCFCLFLLGTAVGGSMPTDGTLFLENLPHSKQYLLTLLSVFFGLGAVLSSVVSYFFLPGASCRHFDGCDVAGGANDGWRRVLFILGLFNLICALMRWFLFQLHESPRYLVSNGREADAVVALRAIATFNAHEIEIHAADVQLETAPCDEPKQSSPRSSSFTSISKPPYDAVGVGPPSSVVREPVRMGSEFYTGPITDEQDINEFDQAFSHSHITQGEVEEEEEEESLIGKDNKDNGLRSEKSRLDLKTGRNLGLGWMESWREQVGKLFVPQWRRTVILMWIIWGSMSFAYTMFNVWLPAVLESRAKGEGDEAIREALTEFVLYSLAGCPGSLLGAWMIQTSLGRRKSLAICTIATALSTFAFIRVSADWAVVVSSMVIALAATAMYAVLYGMTPETFGTGIRGTACGTSAALSRLRVTFFQNLISILFFQQFTRHTDFP
ncbi:membrane transporter [Tremella mesenterica]|uniref:Membrane transporter n=1 Tax=Tremella mesenterica TaxID=5217 RepID=A0A4Q1BP00_TREME|nr:membrane transporter [Tremella mesenterica]